MLYPDFNDLVSYKDLKLSPIRQSHRARSLILGGHRSPFRGQGLEFDSVREYVPGDDIRNIDWRVTARTGLPHLKIFQEEKQRHIILCVDMNSAMRFGTRKTFKSIQAARIAALLGWQGMAHQDKVSACLYGDVPEKVEFFTPKHSRSSFSLFLKRLSEPPIKQCDVFFKEVCQRLVQAAHTGSLIYFISDFMQINKDREEEALLSNLRKRCDVVFISVNDPADKAIFPIGILGFQGFAHEKLQVNTDSPAGREAYALQWQENRKKLYELTSRFKMPLIELTTESDIKKDLPRMLKKR
jgi:uncharacterized protein (DUF58 family)